MTDHYSLYLSTYNTDGKTPYSNAPVISKTNGNGVVVFQVDWDELFNNNQSKYKKCNMRVEFASEYSSMLYLASGLTAMWPTQLALAVDGVPSVYNNTSTISLGFVKTTQDPNPTVQNVLQVITTGTATGSVSSTGELTATSETGNVSVGDFFLAGGNLCKVSAIRGTYGTRIFQTNLPTNAGSVVYSAQVRGAQGPTFGLVLDTTQGLPEQVIMPRGKSNITVKLATYGLATPTNAPVCGQYGMKLKFECIEK